MSPYQRTALAAVVLLMSSVQVASCYKILNYSNNTWQVLYAADEWAKSYKGTVLPNTYDICPYNQQGCASPCFAWSASCSPAAKPTDLIYLLLFRGTPVNLGGLDFFKDDARKKVANVTKDMSIRDKSREFVGYSESSWYATILPPLPGYFPVNLSGVTVSGGFQKFPYPTPTFIVSMMAKGVLTITADGVPYACWEGPCLSNGVNFDNTIGAGNATACVGINCGPIESPQSPSVLDCSRSFCNRATAACAYSNDWPDGSVCTFGVPPNTGSPYDPPVCTGACSKGECQRELTDLNLVNLTGCTGMFGCKPTVY